MVRAIGQGVLRLGPWSPGRTWRPEWGSARRAVLGVLRETGRPMTASEVWHQLGEGWQYVTVLQALKRLAKAGHLLKLRAPRPRYGLLK